jgi:predicted GNAT family acetyltransferase
VNVARFDDPAVFLDAAAVLLADEGRHNLILGVAGTAQRSPDLHPEYHAWLVTDDGEPVAAAALTPPYNLLLARPRSDAALALLVDAIEDELPGVVGAQPEVERFASAWAERTSTTPTVQVAQGIYALEHVQPVPAAPGHMRLQAAGDTELLVAWLLAFEAEALHSVGNGEDRARRIVEYRLTAERAGLMLWENEGEVVSVAGFGGETPNGIRIGPVYTPPGLRGRGYATALVAQLSSQLLAEGRRFCFLYTDLANPTSNAIYERIGYVRICESAEVAFS